MPNPTSVDIDTLVDAPLYGSVQPHDIRTLGPSDSSDSGADMMGIDGLDSTSDRNGTGERESVGEDGYLDTEYDIGADRIVDAQEAGLGGGLDQAEEAQLGITDEEIDAAVRNRLGLESR